MVSQTNAVRILAAFVVALASDRACASDDGARQLHGCAAHAPEAAMRSAIAPEVVLRVMRAESAGIPSVRSPKGAMGCMQIMPDTWAYLAPRYGLGDDPFDPRMNMIGGALYLAELRRRFGMPGAFAAYSAGPARYLSFVNKGVPLPAETVTYVGHLGGALSTTIIAPALGRWQEARLFVGSVSPAQDASDRRDIPVSATSANQQPPDGPVDAMPVGRAAPTLFPLLPDASRRDR